nr:ATP-binding protein [Sedimentibacter sp.]
MEKQLLQQQNNAYSKQFEIINQSQENIKMLRHDMKNHITSLQSLIEINDNESALKYLKDIYNYCNYPDKYVKSGNSEIDSILNYKINKAARFGINVNTILNIPQKLSIQPFDLSVILGNLMDNAIEATLKLDRNRIINVSVEYERNVLYISISNPYDGKLLFKNNKLKTTHTDTENHGIGLSSVRKSINKYNGVLDTHHTDKIFYADVLIYNPVNNLVD